MIDSEKLKTTLQRDLEALRATREELRLQASLARADLRSELERLEQKFALAQEQIGRIGAHSMAALQEIENSVRTIFSELRSGYERLRGQS